MKTLTRSVRTSMAFVLFFMSAAASLRGATALQIDVGPNPLVAFPDEFVFGWEFQINVPIQIHHIGLFDAGGDGFHSLWKISIWSLDGFGGPTSGELDTAALTESGFSYFESVAQLIDNVVIHGPTLQPGRYVIDAGSLFFGGEPGEPRETDLMPSLVTSIVTDPAITFIQARSGMNTFHNEDLVFPSTVEPGLKYMAPNFQFDVVPEPSAGLLLTVGLVVCRRRDLLARNRSRCRQGPPAAIRSAWLTGAARRSRGVRCRAFLRSSLLGLRHPSNRPS